MTTSRMVWYNDGETVSRQRLFDYTRAAISKENEGPVYVVRVTQPMHDRQLTHGEPLFSYEHVVLADMQVSDGDGGGIEPVYMPDEATGWNIDGDIIACHLANALDDARLRFVTDMREKNSIISQHKSTNTQLTEDWRVEQQIAEDLRAEVSELLAASEQWQHKFETMKTDSVALRAQREALNRRLDEAEAKIEALVAQRDELNRRLDERTPDAD